MSKASESGGKTVGDRSCVQQLPWWQRPWVVVVSLTLAGASIVLTLYLFFAGLAEKVPVYTIESRSVIAPVRSGIGGLEIRFRGRKVRQVTSTTVRFWNAGRQTIDATDMLPADKLRFLAPRGSEILSARILRCHRPVAQAHVEQHGSQLDISFAFLDRDDGFQLQVLHTGSARSRCTVAGTIKGARAVREIEREMPWRGSAAVLILLSSVAAGGARISDWIGGREPLTRAPRILRELAGFAVTLAVGFALLRLLIRLLFIMQPRALA